MVDCFAGQPRHMGTAYTIDPGVMKVKEVQKGSFMHLLENTQNDGLGIKNADIRISAQGILANIQGVQGRHCLHISKELVSSIPSALNLDIEMETGTGKTYCYIKTIFELYKHYGWSKFIIVVPSVAIREGVRKSFEMTAEHFTQSYGESASFFVYSSKQLETIESFSSSAGINVMIINVQAFNATGKDARRIYEELDEFKSRKPIDVISANRPILILDEPQKMEGKKTLEALKLFAPLFILRYSATHRTTHNKIFRIDALDAYNQKLVKKIAVRGIGVRGLAGTSAYLYLDSIETSKKAPVALLDVEVKQASGTIKRKLFRISKGDDLFVKSGNLDQYKDFIVSNIDARDDTIEFTNGVTLTAGDVVGDVSEKALRHIQIRDAIRAHLLKEQQLFEQGIKVLTLFFIDEVVKYRDYSRNDTMGEYARLFEEEYARQVQDFLQHTLPVGHEAYREYLGNIDVADTHKGYFSIDKKTKHFVDPALDGRGENKGLGKNKEDYTLILKDKERLLSFEEPSRFIFSHSALREGWDNPNVFVICMLKQSDNTISRRQEVGRGLRISVNQQGERMDNPATIHDVNILTVVTGESYTEFVTNLQREISNTLSARPQKANAAFFVDKKIFGNDGTEVVITQDMAEKIQAWLVLNDYKDSSTHIITPKYHNAVATGGLGALPAALVSCSDGIVGLIDKLFNPNAEVGTGDGRKDKQNLLNAENFSKKEFRELWERIHHKAVYHVDFDSAELVKHAIKALDASLLVTPLQYVIQAGVQNTHVTDEALQSGSAFTVSETQTELHQGSVHSGVPYDLLGKISEFTKLTRQTVTEILQGIKLDTFGKFAQNPEHFITAASQIINEQKASCIIEKLSYDCLNETYDLDIFSKSQLRQDFSKAGEKLQKHIYDYVVTDSKLEHEFAHKLDSEKHVVVYAKLPRSFFIPTPVGNYNPDWAIAFTEGSVKHVYFVAETKGSLSSLAIRGIESMKISCARKFFDAVNDMMQAKNVKYDVVTSYSTLMDIVGRNPS